MVHQKDIMLNEHRQLIYFHRLHDDGLIKYAVYDNSNNVIDAVHYREYPKGEDAYEGARNAYYLISVRTPTGTR